MDLPLGLCWIQAQIDTEDTLMKTPVDYAADHSQEVSELIINAVEPHGGLGYSAL